MNSGTLNLKRIFETERRLVVPLFQRPYVWKREEQWEPLWDDIEAVANATLAESSGAQARPHFLGAVVLDEVTTATGQLDTRLIVDGQQRLTTLQVLLEAFHDYCESSGLPSHARGIRKLTRNDDPMSTDPEDIYKVWPTLVDQPHFKRIMEAAGPAELRALYQIQQQNASIGHAIPDAYLTFYGFISDWMNLPGADKAARANALYSTLREKLRLVVIDLETDDDAQVIFESLNARGTPLLPADLVKNLLFQRLKREGGKIDQNYVKLWRHFDDDDSYWRTEMGRGHAKRARIDIFLQNYLTARKTDEVPTGHLYAHFRDFVAKDGSALSHLESVNRYSRIYRSFDSLPAKSREAAFFARMQVLEFQSVYPFVLDLFARFEAHREVVAPVLVDIESFLVRRMVCGLNTRGYNRIFVDLLKTLPGDAASLRQRVQTALLAHTAASNRWPDDREFGTAWRERPTYQQLNQPRIRLLLEAIEHRLRNNLTEAVQITYEETLTIEHLLPQDWVDYWPLPASADTDASRLAATERRNQLLHNVGNLTLLTQSLNPSVSNGPWQEKLTAILLHSALNLNRPLPNVWDEEAIQKRAEALLATALEIWPRPETASI